MPIAGIEHTTFYLTRGGCVCVLGAGGGGSVGQMPTITLERMFVCGFGYLLCQALFSWKIHNENMPIQNTENFITKHVNFQIKSFDIFITFLLQTQMRF